MNDIQTSLVRTFTPIIVGFILTLALKAGIDIDEGTATNLVQALVTAGYYTIVRIAEKTKPKFGVLLGKAKAPEYAKTENLTDKPQ